MKKFLKVCLFLSVNLFFVIVANAGKEEQKVDDRFPFWDLPDELQDNIWEKVGNDIPPITKNLLLKSYCKKISNQEGNFDPTKAKIIANNLDPMTVKKSVAQDVLQLPETARREVEKHFVGIHKYKLFKELKSFSGHSKNVTGITFNNEGNLVSWSEDRSIRIWDINTEQILSELYSTKKTKADSRFYLNKTIIKKVILDNNGRLLAHIGDGSITICDMVNKKLLKKIKNQDSYSSLYNVILDKKGRIFSVYNNEPHHNTNTIIRMWDLDSGRCLQEFSHGKELIYDFILDEPSGKLFSWVGNEKVYVWDIESGKFLRFIPLPASVKNLVLNGDDLFAFLDRDYKGNHSSSIALRLNLKDGTYVTFKGHRRTILGGIVDKEKRLLFTYSKDNTIRLWDIDSGECLKSFSFPEIAGIKLDGQGYLISWGKYSEIRVWNIETGECINNFEVYKRKYGHIILTDLKNVILDNSGRLFTCAGHNLSILAPPETLEKKMKTYLDYIRHGKNKCKKHT